MWCVCAAHPPTAQAGAHVVINSRNAEACEAMAARIRGMGCEVATWARPRL